MKKSTVADFMKEEAKENEKIVNDERIRQLIDTHAPTEFAKVCHALERIGRAKPFLYRVNFNGIDICKISSESDRRAMEVSLSGFRLTYCLIGGRVSEGIHIQLTAKPSVLPPNGFILEWREEKGDKELFTSDELGETLILELARMQTLR